MKTNPPRNCAADSSMKWGYAFAGACALGFAALIQVAFDGLDEETLARMPALVAVPYGIAGKPGITLPLALLGMALILRDVVINRNVSRRELSVPKGRAGEPGRATNAGEQLEIGEPIAEDIPPPARKREKKITALAGGFGGRREHLPETTGGPVGDSAPLPQRAGSGQIALSSAKYLNKNPGGSFRRGTTQHTNGE